MPQLDLGKVVGDTGPQGPKGDQGIQGPAGPAGPGVAIGGSANQVLVKHSGTNYDTQWVDDGSLPAFAGVRDGLAIVANGDTHPAIASGQFVYVRNHSTLAEGLYKATAAIGTNVALTTSNLTADSAGGLNDLQAQVTSLNSKMELSAVKVTYASGVTTQSLFIRKSGSVVTVNGFVKFNSAPTASTEIGTIEEGNRPVDAVRTNAVMAAQAYLVGENAYFTINSEGVMQVWPKAQNTYTAMYVSCSYHVQR